MLLARDGKAPKKAQRNPAGGRKPHPNFFLLIGGVIVGVMAVLILVGYVWTPYDTTGMSGADKFLAPCLAHPLGTDNFGRDILSRVMEGAGSTFLIALCVVLIGGIIGTVIGCLTGYFGGAADLVLMRVCDAITAFPSILLALVLILPSARIDLAPGIKASTQASVRVEHIQNFARSAEMDVQLLSADDPAYQQIANVLSGLTCVKRFNQQYSSYSHEYPVDSVTVSYYDADENNRLLVTVYSDGTAIVNSQFVKIKTPKGGAEEVYRQLAEIVK